MLLTVATLHTMTVSGEFLIKSVSNSLEPLKGCFFFYLLNSRVGGEKSSENDDSSGDQYGYSHRQEF